MAKPEIKSSPSTPDYDCQDAENEGYQGQKIDLLSLCKEKLGSSFLGSSIEERIAKLMTRELTAWRFFCDGFERNLWPREYGSFLQKELGQLHGVKSYKQYVAHFSGLETIKGLTGVQKRYLHFLPDDFVVEPDSIDKQIENDIARGAELVIMSSVIATNPTFILRRFIRGLEIREHSKKAENLHFKLVFQHPRTLKHLAEEESYKFKMLFDYIKKDNPSFEFDYRFIRGLSEHWELRLLRHLRVFALTLIALQQLKASSDEHFGKDFLGVELMTDVLTFRGNITVRSGRPISTIFQVIPAYVQSLQTIAKETHYDELKKRLLSEIQPVEERENCSVDKLSDMFDYCLEGEQSILGELDSSTKKAFPNVYSEQIPLYRKLVGWKIPKKNDFERVLSNAFDCIGKRQNEVDGNISIGTPNYLRSDEP